MRAVLRTPAPSRKDLESQGLPKSRAGLGRPLGGVRRCRRRKQESSDEQRLPFVLFSVRGGATAPAMLAGDVILEISG